MAGSRVAKIELKTSAAGVDGGLRETSRKLRAFEREQSSAARKAQRERVSLAKRIIRDEDKDARDRARSLRGAGDRGAGLAHSVATGAGAAAGFDIASVLGDAARSVFEVEKELNRLGIDANLSTGEMAAFRDQMMAVSNATGVSRLSLVEAAHAYQILTGDAKGAMSSTKDFADVAIAAGAAPREIAEAAASMRQNLNLDPKDFRKGFDVLLNLGHHGALELRDFAGEMSGIAPQFKQFGGGDAVSKLTELGAALETVKLNFANASETATGLRAAMTQLSKSKVAERLAGAGVDVWRIDPKTKEHVKRDFFDIIADIKKKIPDQKVLADILGGRQESFRAITAMLEHFDEMVKLREQAANSDQVSVDAHRYLESASGRISIAWERIKNSIAGALTPDRIEAFAAAMEHVASFVGNTVDMLDRLINGPKAEEENGRMSQYFVGLANDKDPAHEKAAIANARDVLSSDESAKNFVESDIGGAGVGGATPQLIAAARKAATDFLESEGIHADAWSTKSVSHFDKMKDAFAPERDGKVDPQALSQMGKAIGAEIAAQLAKIGITVKADANAIAQVGKNAPINRGVHK